MPDNAAPTAPNPLTTMRRLAGTCPFGDFSPGGISVLLLCGHSVGTGRTGAYRGIRPSRSLMSTERATGALEDIEFPVASMRNRPSTLSFYEYSRARTRKGEGHGRIEEPR